MTTIAAPATILRVYDDSHPGALLHETRDGNEIARLLGEIGVRFERWSADHELSADADQEAVLKAYDTPVGRLQSECGYKSVDVLRVRRGAPNVTAMRAKFLDEHSHSEDEVRFFVEGRGAFYLRVGGKVYQTICARGDLISVPAGTKHWFDMGLDPEFCVIRLFTNAEGWVANFTGDPISKDFPKLDD
ncbi:MAG: cupin [Candidatus Meridianibacter frigidus]|nr:MAG: cupin [Candidatus Eremiobacteraeota bacterium]